MAQELPRRTNFSGPPLIRLLSRLLDANVQEPGQLLPDRLSQWLGWTHAIDLASALGASPAAGGRTDSARQDIAEAEQDCARVRAMLERAIAGLGEPAPARARARPKAAIPRDARHVPPVEYSIYRQRYVSLQQNMESAITGLRARLRGMLASGSPGSARLAVLDAVMEQALNEREYELLSAVPGLLEQRFLRLRPAGSGAEEEGVPEQPPASGDWLGVFCKDMQSVLSAELDLRLQPVEGLLGALRADRP